MSVTGKGPGRAACLLAVTAAWLSCAGHVGAEQIPVPAGSNFQAALDAAQPGDIIVLESGAVYTGNFVLPVKSGDEFITIKSSGADRLTPGRRVSPAHSAQMARIVAPDQRPALAAAPGAHHYRIVGLEFTVAPGVYSLGLIRLGYGDEMEAGLPHHFELDRVYVHGDPIAGGKRGLALNCGFARVTRSHISDFKSSDQDTQAVYGWNGPGPYEIVDNYLEAGAEVIMFGGVVPTTPGLIPSDILIRGNHITRPLSWRTALSPSGRPWIVKNLVELKGGRRVHIAENTIENTWAGGQVGYAFVLKADVGAVTEDVLITGNIIQNASGGFAIGGLSSPPGGFARNITIGNNLLANMGREFGSALPVFMVLNGADGVVIEHNTVLPTVSPTYLLTSDLQPSRKFVFRSNIVPRGIYGLKGSGKGEGVRTLDHYFPEGVFAGNVIYGSPAGTENLYPSGNLFPAAAADVRWNRDGFLLAPDSPAKGRAHDGADPGLKADTFPWSELSRGGRHIETVCCEPAGRKR